MSRYKPTWIQDSVALKPGWWIVDLARSTPGARVLVGGRHATKEQADSAIAKLEIEERVRQ